MFYVHLQSKQLHLAGYCKHSCHGNHRNQTKQCLTVSSAIIHSYVKYVNGRQTGLVTFYVETAFYNGLLKERYKGG
jgi:hypothetical protein